MPEPFLLQQLQGLQRRARIKQILGILGLGKVLQILEVGDKAWILQEFLRGEMVEIIWVAKRMDKLPCTGKFLRKVKSRPGQITSNSSSKRVYPA